MKTLRKPLIAGSSALQSYSEELLKVFDSRSSFSSLEMLFGSSSYFAQKSRPPVWARRWHPPASTNTWLQHHFRSNEWDLNGRLVYDLSFSD